MRKLSELSPPLSCFYPTLGFFTGFLLACLVHWTINDHSRTAVLAVHMFDLLWGLVGWCSGVVLAGRKIHCGGTLKLIEKTDKQRHVVFLEIVGFLTTVLLVLLFGANYGWFWTLFMIILVLIASEIGWGDYLAFLQSFTKVD